MKLPNGDDVITVQYEGTRCHECGCIIAVGTKALYRKGPVKSYVTHYAPTGGVCGYRYRVVAMYPSTRKEFTVAAYDAATALSTVQQQTLKKAQGGKSPLPWAINVYQGNVLVASVGV